MTIKARFVGDHSAPRDNPETVHAFGTEFQIGEWTEVDKAWESKITGNTHFEIDRDGNGQPDETIDDLRAELDARGIKYSARAGADNLAAKLKEAKEIEAEQQLKDARQQLTDLGVEFDEAEDLDALSAKIEDATKPV